MKNGNIKVVILIFWVLVLIWIPITTTIQRFKCPAMSETELFLHIPKSFICNFKKC